MQSQGLWGEFFRYVVFNVLGMFGLSCYILADTFFIARGLGANGLTALNLAIPVYSFVHGSGLMLGMGGATKYSVFRGQRKEQKANSIYTHTICLAFIFAAVYMLTGIFCPEELADALHADAEVFGMTKTYLQMILLFSPAFLLNDVFLCFVRNDGAPRRSMAAMLIGSFANIILDYFFIFPLQMGITGAVLATGLAPVISIGILSGHRLAGRNQFHLVQIKPSVKAVAAILSLGFPSLIAEVASGIVIIVFNFIILRLQGNTGVAAYGVIANLSLVVTAIYTGIAQGAQPITSRAYGLGRQEETKKILKYAVVTVLVVSLCIYLLFFLAASPIAGIFNSGQDARLQQIAVSGLKLYFTAIPFAGFNMILSMHFSATEKALPAQIISLFRGFFLVIPMAFLLSRIFGMTGVWLSYPLTECVVSIFCIAFARFFIFHSYTI